jgi:hypothetical protein
VTVTLQAHAALEERVTRLETIVAGDLEPETLAAKFSFLRCIVAGNADRALRAKGEQMLYELEARLRPLTFRLARSPGTTTT